MCRMISKPELGFEDGDGVRWSERVMQYSKIMDCSANAYDNYHNMGLIINNQSIIRDQTT